MTDKVIGATPIFTRDSGDNLNEQHIASGVIGDEPYRLCHDFSKLYVVFIHRPEKDSFEVDLKKFIESAYFFDKKQKTKKKHTSTTGKKLLKK